MIEKVAAAAYLLLRATRCGFGLLHRLHCYAQRFQRTGRHETGLWQFVLLLELTQARAEIFIIQAVVVDLITALLQSTLDFVNLLGRRIVLTENLHIFAGIALRNRFLGNGGRFCRNLSAHFLWRRYELSHRPGRVLGRDRFGSCPCRPLQLLALYGTVRGWTIDQAIDFAGLRVHALHRPATLLPYLAGRLFQHLLIERVVQSRYLDLARISFAH